MCPNISFIGSFIISDWKFNVEFSGAIMSSVSTVHVWKTSVDEIIFVIIDTRFFSSSSYNQATRRLTKDIDDESIGFEWSLCIAQLFEQSWFSRRIIFWKERVGSTVKVWSFVPKILLTWGKNAKLHLNDETAARKTFFISCVTTITVTKLTNCAISVAQYGKY